MLSPKYFQKISVFVVGGVLLASASGCVATRKFTRNEVKTNVDPVNAKVGVLETKTTEQGTKIDGLDRGVARLDEVTKSLDEKATAAGRDARAAQQAAAAADAKGASAQSAADQAQGMVRTTDGKVSEATKRIMALEADSYKEVGEPVMVHFGLNKDTLDDEAKAALASMKVDGLKRFAVEVQGFADPSGDTAANIALSQRRANAVVRYLNAELKVPLYRIAVIGSGEVEIEKGLKRKERMAARAEARRVEVKLYSAVD
jgi:outer membrane protein OmpA-like peptidoglycan-associated protein